MTGRSALQRSALLGPIRVTDGGSFALADHPAARKSGLDKEDGQERVEQAKARLSELQVLLAAEARHAMLVVFQAMDAGGKDGTIKHVMSGVNPQGVDVTSFKQPGPVELAHDYLWRVHAAAPQRGRIAIFNRSHYEEVLTCRVHPSLLDAQHLPSRHAPSRERGEAFWRTRFDDIVAFERYLAHQGVAILKFFLHISKEEQRDRLLARLDDPQRNWKFSPLDLAERSHWDAYQHAYEQAIRHTASPDAPWFVVPADHKWYARLVVIEAIVDALERLDPQIPKASGEALDAIEVARRSLD